MPHPEPRTDLVDVLVQSCWLVESARSEVFGRWAGEYAADAERSGVRAEMVARALDGRGLEAPASLLEPHTAWMESVVGPEPEAVALGPAVLERLGAWTDVYVSPYLPDGAEDFLALGHGELRMPVPPRPISPAEARLDPGPLPDGPRFVVLTDIHIGAAGADVLARRAVEEINELSPEFVVVPGDITDDGEPEQFALAFEILSQLRMPFHCVLGNHDAVRRSTVAPVGHALFTEAFGVAPDDTVVECGGVQVALMDSTDPTPSPFPDWDLARGGFRDDAGGVNGGALRPGQADAMAARLDPSRPALVVLHHELQPFAGFPPVMFGLRPRDSSELLSALDGHHLLGVIAGHTHRSARVGSVLEVPALKDWPYCYTVVGTDGGKVRASVRQIGDEELVWKRAQKVPPIYLNYVTGPMTALDHAFGS